MVQESVFLRLLSPSIKEIKVKKLQQSIVGVIFSIISNVTYIMYVHKLIS